MEAVGNSTAGRLAFDLIRPGGIISTVGVHTGTHLDFSPVEAYDKNITYRVGRAPVRAYIERSLQLAARRSSELESVITHRLPLSDGAEGYRIFDEKAEGCLKVVLEP